MRSRNQLEVCPNSDEINGDENGFGLEFSSSNHRRSGQFPATRTAWIRSSSLKLRIGTKHGRWGGQNLKISSGQGRGFRVGSGSNQVKHSLPFSLVSSPLPSLSLSLYIYTGAQQGQKWVWGITFNVFNAISSVDMICIQSVLINKMSRLFLQNTWSKVKDLKISLVRTLKFNNYKIYLFLCIHQDHHSTIDLLSYL